MTRILCWTLAFSALTALAILGCSSREPEPKPATASRAVEDNAPAPSAPTPTPTPTSAVPLDQAGDLFPRWPKPDAALIISGQQLGYLEPCGCTEGQKGGLGRRYDLVEQLRHQGWPLALIDLGSLIDDPAAARGGPQQTAIKFGVALTALEAMKYDALALSPDDLKVGLADALSELTLNNLREQPRVVAANVTLTEGLDPHDQFRPSLRSTAGPVSIGITAVVDPAALDQLSDPAKADFLTIQDPAQVLGPILKDLESDTQVQVLMVQGPGDLARDLAQAFPGFDVVVATSVYPDPPAEPEPLNDGQTLLVTVGKKGQYVGVVGLFPSADPADRLRYQRVLLDTKYHQAEPMRKLIDDDYQQLLKTAGVVENFPRHPYVGGAGGARFVGAEACQSCHPYTFEQWQDTRHSTAYHALTENPKRNREFDAECISCHTVGFGYESGWVSLDATPHLKGVQCESCHGPASKHIAEPDHPDYRRALALTALGADRTGLCNRCHDEDNSPKFQFRTYHNEISHEGLDTYDDPKVHQPQPDRVARQPAG